VYRTAQEALQNVAKHANARSVRVRLYLQRDRMVLEVTDDGTGFDPAAADGSAAMRAAGADGPGAGASAPTGFGLAGMRERAELLGGKLELASSPKRGTTVRLTVPLNPPLAEQARALPPPALGLSPPGPPLPEAAGRHHGILDSRAHPRR